MMSVDLRSEEELGVRTFRYSMPMAGCVRDNGDRGAGQVSQNDCVGVCRKQVTELWLLDECRSEK